MIKRIHDFYKKQFSIHKRLKIKYRLRHLKALLVPFNLSKMALIHKTDKFGSFLHISLSTSFETVQIKEN
jgi:demethylmacrocin O-methyltransferase